MDQLLNTFHKAWGKKEQDELADALDLYNEAFNILIKRASDYVNRIDGVVVDEGNTTKFMPALFTETKKYLKRDTMASVIMNNMGIIFSNVGQYELAKQHLEQAIELTPDDMEFREPMENLARVNKLLSHHE